MKTIKLELNNNEKKYLQIYNYLKNSILDGKLFPNEILPSKRILATDLNVSLNTIIQAYNLLLLEGFIYSIEKKGYYVVDYNLTRKTSNTVEYKSVIKNEYRYDLTTQNVDTDVFPFSKWNKLYNKYNGFREILYKSPNKGLDSLRETLAHNIYEAKGVLVNKENIIIGCGVEYLLSIITKILPINNYIIEAPGYTKIKQILLNNSTNPFDCELDNEGLMIYDAPNGCNIYTTPASEFPLGISMSLKRKGELISYARTNNSYIIEDDFDSEYKYLSSSTPLLALDKEKVIFLKTFSRTIAPSFRLAYMVLPDSLIDIYNTIYGFYSNTVSSLNQLVLNEFISNGGYYRHLNKTRLLYKEKRSLLLEEISKASNLEVINSNGLLSILVKVSNTNILLLKEKLEKEKINISFINHPKYNDYLIIGYSSISYNEINEAMNILLKEIEKARL